MQGRSPKRPPRVLPSKRTKEMCRQDNGALARRQTFVPMVSPQLPPYVRKNSFSPPRESSGVRRGITSRARQRNPFFSILFFLLILILAFLVATWPRHASAVKASVPILAHPWSKISCVLCFSWCTPSFRIPASPTMQLSKNPSIHRLPCFVVQKNRQKSAFCVSG